MNIEIPAELLLPTIEELAEKTTRDQATKWKPRKRLGKKERAAIKQEKEAAKLKAIKEEFDKPKQPVASKLSSLFVKNEAQAFSLKDVNVGNTAKALRPTLRVSLGESSPKPAATDTKFPRKRGRPPKVKSL